MPAMESRVEGVWFAKQTAKGSAAATPSALTQGVPTHKVGGDVNVNRNDNSENYSDGTRYGSALDFVDTIVGEGSNVAQGQPGVAAYLTYLMAGQESVSGGSDPFTHTITPASASFWFTCWKKVGATVGPLRQRFVDSKMTSLRVEGSSANKVVKLTPGFTSLTSDIFTTDPTVVEENVNAFLYTEGIGRFNIDGTNYSGHSSFAIVLQDSVAPWYGDDVVPFDVTFGVAAVTIEGVTLLVDATGLQFYNNQIYGSTTPAFGAAPLKTIPALGTYTVDLQRGANRQLKFNFLHVHWAPDMAIAGNPDGGPIELALGAMVRTVSPDPTFTGTFKTNVPAFI